MIKIGSKIRIINMKGEPRYNNKTGVVRYIDCLGQIHGSWGGCALIPEEDEFELLESQALIVQTFDN